MVVQLINQSTGKDIWIKVGFSWTLFLFASFGIPLFLRGLVGWALFFMIYDIILVGFGLLGQMVEYILGYLVQARGLKTISAVTVAKAADGFISLSIIVLHIWIARKGNGMAARYYIAQGWLFYDKKSEDIKKVKVLWNISE